MWLELPANVVSGISGSTHLEHSYYKVVLSLFSLLTHCVDHGAEGAGEDTAYSEGLAKTARSLLQSVLMVCHCTS